MKGYEILSKVLNDEIKSKMIIKTEHEIQNFDDYKEYDYYLVENDKMLHRCNVDGKLGSKYQDRFLNYKVLEKDFEIYKIIEEDEKIEKLNLPSFEEFKNMSVAERYVVTAKEYDVLNELIDEINNLKEK